MKFKILKKESYPSCVKLTIETEVKKKVVSERFSFSHDQINTGTWKNMLKEWVEKQEVEYEEPDINEGEEFEI